MAFFSWSRWLRSLLRPRTKPIQRLRTAPRTTLRLEALEARLAPASFVWNGGGADGKWGTPTNWQGNVAPASTDPGPDDLSFQFAPGTNVLTNDVKGLTINSISFSSSFTISGNPITLGSSGTGFPSAGKISVNGLGIADTLGLQLITLAGGGSASAQQTFQIGASDTLTLNGQLAGTAGKGLLETGGGTLVLAADNTAFTGPFEISGSVTQISNNFALGSATDVNDGTTVDGGGQLQVVGAPGIIVPEFLELNGAGVGGLGALYTAAGTANVWSGPIKLDSDATVGGVAGTDLNITGAIADLGSGHNVTKEGQGTIGFAGTDTYRGTTTVNNGVLRVSNSQGLGTGPGGLADDSTADAITVNNTATEQGTLQLSGPAAGNGLDIVNKLLILNGAGFNPGTGGLGALDNLQGNNTWTGNVILGSPAPNGSGVTIRADANPAPTPANPNYTLTISGIVEDPYLPGTNLTKTFGGILDFTNSNTYTGITWVQGGILEIQDSQGLGQVGKQGNVFVSDGASLELRVDNILDSVTKTRNQLLVSNKLFLWGPGAADPITGIPVGALYSASGINTYAGPVNIAPIDKTGHENPGRRLSAGAGIGVDADPNPTKNANYLVNDYSLTLNGNLIGGWNLETGAVTKELVQKFGAGNLILPTASAQYLGDWDVAQGFVTVENNNSLGQLALNSLVQTDFTVTPSALSQADEPTVTVESGAALHLNDTTGNGLNLGENFILAGQGISHTFNELSQQGALENLNGINTIAGNIVFQGQAGVGVERVFSANSQLSLLGTQSDVGSNLYEFVNSGSSFLHAFFGKPGSGSSGAEDVNVIDTGSSGGTITINYNMTVFPGALELAPPRYPNSDLVPDKIDVYSGIYYGQPGATPIGGTGGYVNGKNSFQVSYGPGGSPFISIVVNQGGNRNPFPFGADAWQYNVDLQPGSNGPGGLIKSGSGLLNIQGDGTFTGGVDVQAGVLLAQNNSALGAPESNSTVTVEPGAALAFGNGTAYHNGGVVSGTQVWGQHLIVNGNANAQLVTIDGAQTGTFQLKFGAAAITELDTVTAATLKTDLNAMAGIQAAGGVTVTQNGNAFLLVFKSPQPLLTVPTSSGATISVSTGVGNATLGAPVGDVAVWSSNTSPWNNAVTLFQSSAYLNGLPGSTVVQGGTSVAVGSGNLTPVDVEWRGPVTLNGHTPIDVGSGSRFIIDGAVDDATSPLANGADLLAVNTGELVLNDASTYRGNTYLGTSATAGTAGYDPYLLNEFFNGGAALPNPGGKALGTVVTVGNSQGLGAAGTNVVIQGGSSVQLEGAVAVAGKTLILNGSGLASTGATSPASWFQQGPAPVLNGQTNGNTSVSGRMTGIAVAPNDPNTIYVSTAGGGAWKTVNGGKTWVQIFDNSNVTTNPDPRAVSVPLFTGAIAVDPYNPNVVFVGTGESNNSGDSYYGTGVYMSLDGGHSWRLLYDNVTATPQNWSANPAFFSAVSRMVVDPTTSFTETVGTQQVTHSQYVYVALNDWFAGPVLGAPTQAGVWRYDLKAGTWFDLTAWPTITRTSPPTKSGFPKTAPGTPGPNDDYRLSFPQGTLTGTANSPFDNGTNYSDLAFVNGVLYMALGSPGEGEVSGAHRPGYLEGWFSPTVDRDPALMNAVYRCINPEAATANPGAATLVYPQLDNPKDVHRPIWYVGDGNPFDSNNNRQYDKGGNAEYPTDIAGLIVNGGAVGDQAVRQGMVKFTGYQDPATGVQTFYAVNANPLDYNLIPGENFLDIQKGNTIVVTLGGRYAYTQTSWAKTAAQPLNFLGNQGDYDTTVTTSDGVNVFVGGVMQNQVPGFENSGIFWSPDGGVTWNDISKLNPSPHTDEHAAATDALGNLYMGGDGGIYKFTPSTGGWTDLNNNLATLTLNSIAVNPQNPDIYFAGAQDNGAFTFNGSQQWTHVQDGDGGLVRIDPNNPQIIYEVQNGFLTKSTTGGGAGSFVALRAFTGGLYFPFAIDPINSNRLLIGGAGGIGLNETDNQGASFTFIGPLYPNRARVPIAALAMSTYQGLYEPDANFPLVPDRGANNDDSKTIYVTDGSTVYYTKDDGTSWKTLTAGLPAVSISDLEVDPRNRDKVYLTATDAMGSGLGRVFALTYVPATKSYFWQEIGGNKGDGLPDVPTYKLAIDPHTGNLYAGTDVGVYEQAAAGGPWTLFGTGQPQASVRDMVIDPNTNMLTIATYGRSAYQVLLNDTAANLGALVSLTGVGQWNGPVVLTGATTVSAGGTQVDPNVINNFAATLNISGKISDLVTGTTTNKVTVGTPSDLGTVIFSGPNDFTDPIEVADGVLVADNQTALGSTASAAIKTTVDTGTALKLETTVNYAGTLILNGDGPLPAYNGHNSGALQSISNGVTYNGPIVLNTPQVTIGVNSGSTLTLTGVITDGGIGANLVKELTGTLILDTMAQDTYGGTTSVYQGALQLASQLALPVGSSTFVYDGAQLQLAGSITVGNKVTVDLAGSGINGTGALLNVSGNNTFDSTTTLILDATPGFSATTYPVGTVTIATGYDGDQFDINNVLNIAGTIQDATTAGTLFSGITKVGPDTLALAGTNSYFGTTFITNGYVQLQSAGGLGDNQNTDPTYVDDTIQRLTGVDPAQVGSFTVSLSLGGTTATSAAIPTSGGAAGIATLAQAQLNNTVLKKLKTAGVLPNSAAATVMASSFTVHNTTVTEFILTVIFTGLPAGLVMPQLVALATNGATVIESNVADHGFGAEVVPSPVSAGAGLQLAFAAASTNTISGEDLLLTGTGGPSTASPTATAGNGALENVSGNNTWSGNVTLNSTGTTLEHDSVGADLAGNTPTLTLSGTVAGLPSAELDKVGPGTLALTGANTFQGTTDVQVGYLDAGSNLALGGTLTDEVQTITPSGALTGSYTLSLGAAGPSIGIPTDYTNPATLGNLQSALNGLVGAGNSIASQQTINGTIVKATEAGTTVTITTSAPMNIGVGQQVTIAGIATAGYNGMFTVTAVAGNTFTYTDAVSGLANDTGGGTASALGAIYTVTFVGALAGTDQLPLVLSSITAGSQVDLATVTNGGLGNTIVEHGATLQVSTGVHVSTEQLILNGTGVGGVGALEGLGTESWDPDSTPVAPNPLPPDASIILASDTAIGVDKSGTFNVTEQISGSANLTKVGSGVLIFSNSTQTLSNTYTGLTTVADGQLWLKKNGGALAVPHDLTVGDTVGGPDSAIAKLQGPAQFLPTATVTVNSDGLFDGNGQTATVGTLIVNDGTAQSGSSPGLLTVNALTMNGGTLTTNDTGNVTLGGDVTATSDATQVATITGTGTFNVGSGRTFKVTHAAATQSADLEITLPIADTLSFTKTGNGRLKLDADSSATSGAPTVSQGELQVDGKVNTVVLNGGILAGGGAIPAAAGQVGNITGTGTVNPGDNGLANPDGILETTPGGTETWFTSGAGGSVVTFAPDLINPKNDHGASLTAGSDYDQLLVNGKLDLGGLGNAATGAQLAGVVGANVLIGDSFTVIQAVGAGSQITGRFVEGFGEELNGDGISYIDGQKFDVHYTATTVTLTRVKENVTLSISDTAGNPSLKTVYGQDANFRATMVAELGAGKVPSYDSVTFTVDETTPGNPSSGLVHESVLLDNNDQAVFDPQLFGNFTVPVGAHTVSVLFNGDPAFNTPPEVTMTWNIGKDNSQIGLTTLSGGTAQTAVYGETVALTATVTASSPGGQTPLFQIPSSPFNALNVTYSIDGGPSSSTYLDATGHVTFPLPTLSLGTHRISAGYQGDGNYGGSTTNFPVTVTVNKDASSVSLNATPTSPGTVGQPVTITAVVATTAPGTAAPGPGDTVTFSDGTTLLGTGTVGYNAVKNDYEASWTTAAGIGAGSLGVGNHTFNASFSGDANISPSSATPLPYVVNPITTNTALATSVNPSALNQVVTFTATVSSATTAGAVTGSVSLYENYNYVTQTGTRLGIQTLSSTDTATFALSTLAIGNHALTAVYSGATNYGSSPSAVLSQVVQYSTTTQLSAAPTPGTYGQTVNLTATVLPGPGMPAAAGTPTGSVSFYTLDGGKALLAGPIALSGGAATAPVSSLAVGNHTIEADYTPLANNNFQTSTSNLVTLPIESATAVALTSTPNYPSEPNTAGLGTTVTFTATLTKQSPGATAAFGGTVTFTDFFGGSTTTLAAGVAVNPTTGQASFPTSSLALGVHGITAIYSGNLATLDAGQTSSTLPETIDYAVSVGQPIPSQNPSPFGTNLTFVATVAAAAGTPAAAGSPTGTVTFFDGTTALGAAVNVVAGTATFTTTSPLPVGAHSITAVFNGNTTFAPAASSALSQNVLNTTTTAVFSSLNPTTFGQSVTFTASVSNTSGAATPAGTVNFFDNGGTLLNSSGPLTLDGTGSATFSTAALAAGPHNVKVVFNTNNAVGGFYTSTSPVLAQVVNQANTTTTLVSSKGTTAFGETVTFTATVATLSPGVGIPSGGTVFFIDGLATIGSGTVNNAGVATFQTSALSVNTHNMSATFSGTANFKTSTGSTNQTVVAADTTTQLLSSANPAVTGQLLTFTATVTTNSPGTGTPTGTVTFLDNGNPIGSGTLNGSGQTTFKTSTLAVGVAHSITASYGQTTNFNTSTSAAISQVVNADATSTTLASSVNPSVDTQPVIFTATVTANGPGSGTPTGTVNFFADGNTTPIGSGTLDGTGHATFTTNALSVGGHNVTAVYVATPAYLTSTSAVVNEQVNVDGTTTTLKTSGTPSLFSQPVTFTAVVTPASPGTGIATGTVTFSDTSTGVPIAQNISLDGTGTATFTTSALSVGLHNVVASFIANSSFTASSSALISQVVKADGTTTALVSSGSPSSYGQAVTFTATVTAQAPGTGFAAGSVTFTDTLTGQTLAANVPLNANGQAAFTTSTLAGTANGPLHNIVASFNATGNFNASSNSPGLPQQVNPASTLTTIAATINPTVYGQAAGFTIAVTPTGGGAGTPQGTVTIYDGTNPLGTTLLDGSGHATFTTTATALSVGPHSITAVYGTTANYLTSKSAVAPLQVNAAATLTAVTSSVGSSAFGQSVTFTATVQASSPGSGTPQGAVNFFDNGTQIGTGTLNASGQATFATSGLAVTPHSITAAYVATTNYAASTSNGLSQFVNADGTGVTLSTSLTPAAYSQPVTFSAVVVAAAPGGGIPSGIVTFLDGNNVIGTGTLDATGTATLSSTTLPAGNHTITASYGVTASYQGSSGAPITEVITKAGTTTTVTPSTGAAVFSQPVTFTATVMAASPGSGPVTSGFVTFTDSFTGATLALNVPLNSNGQATVTTSTLAVGTHNVSASYVASTNYSASSSTTAATVSVALAATATTLTSSGSLVAASVPPTYTSVYSQAVTLTAVVNAAPGTAAPAGTVAFKSGTLSLGSAVVAFNAANNDYEANLTTTILAVGNDSLTASYTPANTKQFKASTATAITEAVTADTTTVTVISSANPSVANQAVAISALVTADGLGSGTPTGTVKFVDTSKSPNTTLGTATLSGGKATITVSNLSFGTHTIQAIYTPANANFKGNTGSLNQQALFASKTTVALSSASSYLGGTITLSATVGAGTGAPLGSAPPSSGSVTFFDGTTILGIVGFDSPGKASLPVSGLTLGAHKITAQFSGDGTTYAVSTSAAATETVYAVPVSLVATLVKAPTNTSTPFTVIVQAFDANGNLITASPTQAIISEEAGGPSGSSGPGFFTTAANFTAGKTNAFVFNNLKVQYGGAYTLDITVNTPDGPVTTSVSFSGVGGRLH